MLAVLAVAVGLVAPNLVASLTDTSATDRIRADPPPALFANDVLTRVEHQTAAQSAPAHELMQQWWSVHGSGADDAAFLSWVEQQVPAPPAPAVRTQQFHQVQQLSAQRNQAGITAATWLEEYGKEDIWKLYMHDQAELLPTTVGDTDKTELNDMLNMARDAADAVAARDQQPAPYVLDPLLRTDHNVNPGDVCPCSYPSSHGAAGAAAITYLGRLAPDRVADYRRMDAEISYSRLYMAGHVISDITAGHLLGDMIGEYFLVTRGHLTLPGDAS